MLLAVIAPIAAMAVTYAYGVPWLRQRNRFAWQELNWRSPLRANDTTTTVPTKSKVVFRVAIMFAITISFVALVGSNFQNGFVVLTSVFNVFLAGLGVHVLTRKSLLAAGVLPLLFIPVARNLLVALAVVGAYYVVSNSLSIRATKVFIIALVLMDVFMIASGTFTRVFPAAFADTPGPALAFFSFPLGVTVGSGDFLGLLLLGNVVMVEHGRRGLVGVVYLAGMLTSILLVLGGVYAIVPATLPLVPALLVHQLAVKQ